MKDLQLRNGDVILVSNHFSFFKPMTWLFQLIKLFTFSRYNHACVYLSINEKGFIIEALQSGITLTEYDKWLGRAERDILVLRHHSCIKKSFTAKALEYMHTKYEYSVFIKFVFHSLFKKLIKFKKEDNKLYCFEFVAKLFDIHFDKFITANDIILSNKFNIIQKAKIRQ